MADDSHFRDRKVTSFFYPQSGVDLHSKPLELAAVKAGDAFPCSLCGAAIPGPLRLFKGERFFCDDCLKARWFHTAARPDGTARSQGGALSHLPLGVIFSFCSEFRDYTRWAAVSRRWFHASNADTWEECELTTTKRILIGREIGRQKERAGEGQAWRTVPPLVDFVDRLQLAPLLGEWADGDTAPPRKAQLARWIVASDFYAESLEVRNPAFLRHGAANTTGAIVEVGDREGDSYLRAEVGADGAAVVLYRANKGFRSATLDPATGFVAAVQDAKGGKDKCVVM